MHLGCTFGFQNPNNALSDAEVYRQEVRLAERVEPLGFDSIWVAGHHFPDSALCPDTVHCRTYLAARASHGKLGWMAVILPWPGPLGVAEQVSLLDHLSNGRYILGFGRGLARVEYEGFRIDQNE